MPQEHVAAQREGAAVTFLQVVLEEEDDGKVAHGSSCSLFLRAAQHANVRPSSSRVRPRSRPETAAMLLHHVASTSDAFSYRYFHAVWLTLLRCSKGQGSLSFRV